MLQEITLILKGQKLVIGIIVTLTLVAGMMMDLIIVI